MIERMTAEGAELDTLSGDRMCGVVALWCAQFTARNPDICVDAVASADAVVSDNPAAIRFARLDYGRTDDELRRARQFLRAAAVAEVEILVS